MIIRRLESTDFRNCSSTSLSLSPNLNIFLGKNGSGKTSILEIIHLLGFGRSFRTNKLNSCICHNKSKFVIFAQAEASQNGNDDNLGYSFNVGLSKSKNGELFCQVDGDHNKRLIELVSLFPTQLFTPQSTDIIIGTPKDRRKFLDWGVFHVEQSYGRLNRNYRTLLKQRNAQLKSKVSDERAVETWDVKLSEFGENVTKKRREYLHIFKDIFKDIQLKFLSEIIVEIEYNKGWKKELSLSEALLERRSNDMQFGATSIGPHKADIKFKVNGIDAAEVLSRGQLRMVVAALLLSQTIVFNRQTKASSIFLLDDLGAELDEQKRELFLDQLVKTNSQILVTAIDKEQLRFTNKYDNKKMFHVEHGSVIEE